MFRRILEAQILTSCPARRRLSAAFRTHSGCLCLGSFLEWWVLTSECRFSQFTWRAFDLGLAYGAAIAIAPLYLSDVVPARLRGRSVSSANVSAGKVTSRKRQLSIMAQIFAIVCNVLSTITVWGSSKRSDSLSYKIPLTVQCAVGLSVVFVMLSLCPLSRDPFDSYLLF